MPILTAMRHLKKCHAPYQDHHKYLDVRQAEIKEEAKLVIDKREFEKVAENE